MVFGGSLHFASKFREPDLEALARRLTDFDTPGQLLTLGDKTTLFLAVFLKKVRVL